MVILADCDSADPCSIHGLLKFFHSVQVSNSWIFDCSIVQFCNSSSLQVESDHESDVPFLIILFIRFTLSFLLVLHLVTFSCHIFSSFIFIVYFSFQSSFSISNTFHCWFCSFRSLFQFSFMKMICSSSIQMMRNWSTNQTKSRKIKTGLAINSFRQMFDWLIDWLIDLIHFCEGIQCQKVWKFWE
jgi:hypothetical protein